MKGSFLPVPRWLQRGKDMVERFRSELAIYRKVIVHPACPRRARFFLGAAIAYALSPVDLIPDFIPVLGCLDDLLIVPLLLWLGLRAIPAEVVRSVREQHACAGGTTARPFTPQGA